VYDFRTAVLFVRAVVELALEKPAPLQAVLDGVGVIMRIVEFARLHEKAEPIENYLKEASATRWRELGGDGIDWKDDKDKEKIFLFAALFPAFWPAFIRPMFPLILRDRAVSASFAETYVNRLSAWAEAAREGESTEFEDFLEDVQAVDQIADAFRKGICTECKWGQDRGVLVPLAKPDGRVTAPAISEIWRLIALGVARNDEDKEPPDSIRPIEPHGPLPHSHGRSGRGSVEKVLAPFRDQFLVSLAVELEMERRRYLVLHSPLF
jgi:hypothetical protein